MTREVSADYMANVRRSLAEAGIFFDKLYINQAYFNSSFSLQPCDVRSKRPKKSFWHRLLCGSEKKRSTTATQTMLTVRDECELITPTTNSRSRMLPADYCNDYRRYRPLNRDLSQKKCQQPIRRRRSSVMARTIQRQKQVLVEDDYDEFAV